jgi:drug/metabolite transporter (DMT)-like permease
VENAGRASHWALLVVIGMLASVGHYLLIRAYDYASASLLALLRIPACSGPWLGSSCSATSDGWALGMKASSSPRPFIVSRQRLTVHRGV